MKLSSLFTDHAVLQQHKTIPVWGWGNPNALYKAELNENTVVSKSNDHGKFMLRLPAMTAGGPYQLKVTEVESGESITADDILIGEVWLASGQSNMEMKMKGCEPVVSCDGADFPAIRVISPDRQASMGGRVDFDASWKVCTPENAEQFTAAGYFFAERLHKELGVPVGILSSSWGGTIIESWTSRQTLVNNPDLHEMLQRYEKEAVSESAWMENGNDPKARFPRDPGNNGVENNWHSPDFDDSEWKTMELPSTWQRAGHEFSGVFWFRKKVSIPQEWVGEELLLSVGAIDKQDITYVNGVEIGRTGKDMEDKYWDLTRKYTIPAEQNSSSELVIAVRVYSFAYSGGISGREDGLFLTLASNSDKRISLAGSWEYEIEHNFGYVSTVLPMGEGNANSPYMLFNNHIAPLVPYALRGAIWYQGESNSGSTQLAFQYRRKIKDLIRDWRFHWGQGDFPFIQVQLANYLKEEPYQDTSTWAVLRESQMDALELDQTGVAVIIDAGDANDIHPKDKKTVGFRLAQWALAETYGKNIVASGPIYQSYAIEGDAIRITFRNIADGLCAKGGGTLKGFYIASDNGRHFVEADAEIQGNTILVKKDGVSSPAAVRYAWSTNPAGCNLYNSEDLPASPFRTDCW